MNRPRTTPCRTDAIQRFAVMAHFIIWIVLVLKVTNIWLVPAINQKTHFGILLKNSIVTIIDFPAHFTIAASAWLGHRQPNISLYSVANHLQTTSAWLGEPSSLALPFGYSPTMLLVLAPLVPFSQGVAFGIFNLIGLLAIWWQTYPRRCCLGVGLLVFCGPLGMACFALGQTAMLTGAGLLFLHETSFLNRDKTGVSAALPAAVVLWLLTAKPPLALMAAAVFLAMRQWRPLLLAAILTTAGTLAVMPLLGPNWLSDYLHMLGSYNRIDADPAFAQSFAPLHMTNLRGIMNINLGLADNLACQISTVIWLSTMLLLVGLGHRLQLTRGALWALGILAYLLFCPHVTSTEELQLLLLIPLCVPVYTAAPLRWQETLLLVTVCLLPFTSPAVGPFDNRLTLFFGKLVLMGFIAVYWRENKSPLTRPAATLSPGERVNDNPSPAGRR